MTSPDSEYLYPSKFSPCQLTRLQMKMSCKSLTRIFLFLFFLHSPIYQTVYPLFLCPLKLPSVVSRWQLISSNPNTEIQWSFACQNSVSLPIGSHGLACMQARIRLTQTSQYLNTLLQIWHIQPLSRKNARIPNKFVPIDPLFGKIY